MKKLIALFLALALLVGAMSVVLAEEPEPTPVYPEGMPDDLQTAWGNGEPETIKSEYQKDEPLSISVAVTGFIGLADPQYDITLNVNNVVWWVDQSTNGSVVSPDYEIKNNSEAFDLLVAFGGFKPNDGDATTAATNDLELFLDGALSLDGLTTIPNLALDTGKQGTYVNKLGKESSWFYSFRGEYPAEKLSKTPLMPAYTMTLVFDIPGENQTEIAGYDGIILDAP